MKSDWYPLLRSLLFRLDPETAHNRTLEFGELVQNLPWLLRKIDHRQRIHHPAFDWHHHGLHFTNPIGLAAGLDKNGRSIPFLFSLGFGSLEIGSISAHPSLGNLRPRLHRLPLDESLLVHYGVPNEGAERIRTRLPIQNLPGPLGINVVQTHQTHFAHPITPNEVIDEFYNTLGQLSGCCDYWMLNLSCPNSRGGESCFQNSENLRHLFERLHSLSNLEPVFLKIPVSLDEGQAERWITLCDNYPFIQGFQFNLTPGNPYTLRTPKTFLQSKKGALSGPPTACHMNQALQLWYRKTRGTRFCLLGGGGIFSADDAYEKIKLGASWLQIYTVLVYKGPDIVRRLNEGILERLQADGFKHLSEAVGCAVEESKGRKSFRQPAF